MSKKTFLSGMIASALVAGLSVGMSTSASAAVIQCSSLTPDISSQVVTNAGCEILSPLNGQVNDDVAGTAVNEGGFFGATASDPDSLWTFGGKYLESGSTPYAGISITGTALEGTWSVDQTVLNMYEIMFIFKDGNDTNLVGYLIETTSGTYETPFLLPPFVAENGNATSKNISHVSVYYRDAGDGGPPPAEVPEPGPLSLLGLGLMGLWFARRKINA
ncbi:PEP-CTERM sorting domain-containing protein [Thauera sp.]|jgi:hypothetical protein|uniref:PEP-CTERM sorting domain-containing protein n=1 Tax=Thauera sp. TaxID=1905334 RepID=UPI002A3675F8|nr:PEP-CTERM sorting domain-containing protein [Thauera sp.]MDX9884116.1 PEP-CTERM sorting domain-containing protein [Thauera sp.]